MSSKTINEFSSFISYIESLRNLPEQYWMLPIAPGKWILKELVCHLWNWDHYSLNVMIPLMEAGAKLPDFVNIEEHNEAAKELAKSFNNAIDLIDVFVKNREEMVQLLIQKYDKTVRFTIGNGKRQYSFDSYVGIFTHHDEHHKTQIEDMKRRLHL
ncbi:DinB family protein [Paenibacillus sp. LHD-117]|uniref:DinB family protein n=1 Tax=Paenibacillus sp. LHD-117 TaxID=3071412 RepID=UPI0027E1BC75|nr:DinB family protein [Paenibacillus sp. LHD-117]MDQ6421770.1 DinB family protein [Paenibacillus sp. LHD-117]